MNMINRLVILCTIILLTISCGGEGAPIERDLLTKLWLSIDGNEFDIDLSELDFNKEFRIDYKDRFSNVLCRCTSVFIGDADEGIYTMNCPSSCPVQFSTLNTANGLYTHSANNILELCRDPNNLLLCRQYK